MTTTMMKKETKTEVSPSTETQIIDLLFRQVNEPPNVYKIKAINVFDNAYRINIWSETYDNVSKLNKIKISHSYFCKLVGSDLIVNL
jgi:hypothetical protein